MIKMLARSMSPSHDPRVMLSCESRRGLEISGGFFVIASVVGGASSTAAGRAFGGSRSGASFAELLEHLPDDLPLGIREPR